MTIFKEAGRALLLATCLLLLLACNNATGNLDADIKTEAQSFIDEYTNTFINLRAVSAEASWLSNILIIEGVKEIDRVSVKAEDALYQHTGSVRVIERTQDLLKHKDQLSPLQVKQLESILRSAANNPQTAPELVKERIEAETEQVSKLYGFTYTIDGKEVTPNELDEKLKSETNLEERRKAWESSKAVGSELKGGLENLASLRNRTVQGLGYSDYFSYQVSDYGMTTEEMMDMMNQFLVELRPLYTELHTWVRHELADRYKQDVPELIPAHWLSNRWGQDWSELVTVEGIDLDGALAKKEPEWLVKQAERFYVSLGFDPLPQSFYELSSLYPVDAESGFKKNTHASAWHMNLKEDVRSLMSVESNARWYETTHHELGHIYYYMSYTRPEVPPLLRGGANRAFHEAVGSLMGMSSMQKPFLAGLNLIEPDAKTDDMAALLKEALNFVVFIPFSAGTMSHFERDLYAQALEKDAYNQRWWQYVTKFQGIEPPSARDERYCDAATKTHINDDAAQYYDYAISNIVLTQMHVHIATNILKQNPHQTNYFGSKEVGSFLKSILEKGAVEDWRKVMRDSLGQDVSAKPMLEYYQPLMDWLKEQNKGRTHTLPAL